MSEQDAQNNTNSNEFKAELVANVAAAFFTANTVSLEEIPNVINVISNSLETVLTAQPAHAAEQVVRQEPAVSIKKSITPDFLISLEDGRKLKSLKRYLRTKYNMTPDDYRTKWGLAKDYPMVAPNYAKARSEMAKKIGLGRGLGGTNRSKKKEAPAAA